MLYIKGKITRPSEKPASPGNSSISPPLATHSKIKETKCAAELCRLKSSSLASKSFVDEPKTPDSPKSGEAMRSRSCEMVARTEEESKTLPNTPTVQPSSSNQRTGIPRAVHRNSEMASSKPESPVDDVQDDKKLEDVIKGELKVITAVEPLAPVSKPLSPEKTPVSTAKETPKRDKPRTRLPGRTASGIPLCQKTPSHSRNIPSFRAVSVAGSTASQPKTGSARPKRMEPYKPNLEMQYNIKLKRLVDMKKELIDKQKPILELYKSLMVMRKNIWKNEKKDVAIEDIKIIEVNPEVLQSIISGPREDLKDKERIQELKTKAKEIPKTCMALCHEILNKRYNTIDNIFSDQGEIDQEELAMKIKSYKLEMKTLENNIDKMYKKQQEEFQNMVNEYEDLIIRYVQTDTDDSMVMQKLETKLQETEHRLAQSVAELTFEKAKKVKENERLRESDLEMGRLREKVQSMSKDLEDERSKNATQKERSSQYEHRFKSMKFKIREIEAQKVEMENKVEVLNTNLKKMEEQMRQRDSLHEHKIKDYEKKIKTQDTLIAKLERERQTVDARLKAKDDHLAERFEEYAREIDELGTRIDVMKEAEENWLKTKLNMEMQYDMLRAQIVDMEVYKQNFFELTHSKCKDIGEKPDFQTEREIHLWTELELTQTALRQAHEKIEMYAEEKARFLDLLSENYKNDECTADLTAKLLQKEHLITSLLLQKKQLSSDLHDVRMELERQQQFVSSMQQQICVPKTGEEETGKMINQYNAKLDEAHRRNAELSCQLTAVQQKLEESERTLKEYDKMIEFRDGLLSMVQAKKNITVNEKDSLQNYAEKLREQYQKLSVQYDEKSTELKNLHKLLVEKNKLFQENEKKYSEMEKLYNGVTKKKFELQEQINNLQRDLAIERTKIEKIYERYESIKSLTQPKLPIELKRLQRYPITSTVSLRAVPKKYRFKPKTDDGCLHVASVHKNIFRYGPPAGAYNYPQLIAGLQQLRSNQSEFIGHVKTLFNFNSYVNSLQNRGEGALDYRPPVSQKLSKMHDDLGQSLELVSSQENMFRD